LNGFFKCLIFSKNVILDGIIKSLLSAGDFMENICQNSDNPLKYTIKKSRRAKRMRISVNCLGEVKVIAPVALNIGFVEKFVEKQKEWIKSKVDYYKNHPVKSFFQKIALSKHTKKEFKENKEKISAIIKEKIDYFNNHYNFAFNRIFIKNQKSRWGSCSKTGNLNFNYKMNFLPEKFQDYIIVHELCHLKEFNHSANFWNLVAEKIPDYKEIRQNLRRL